MSVESFLSKASKTISKKKETKEIDIESEYCKYAKKRNCLALKLIFLNKKGFPDRTTLCPGAKVLFIEFKRKDKEQSGPQKVVQKLLERFGFEYYVCDELGQAEKILDEFLAFND